MAATPLQHIVREITEIKRSYEQAVLEGKAEDFADYRHLAGVIRGLTQAEYIVKDLVQKLEQSDE
jgi:hypothetical protein